MLNLDQRALFLDALRPPDGYRFDCGIGTTFTLDLLTLLVAPLSLAWLEVSDAGAALADPILLLEGLQRHADRLVIFCQAGRIAIPPPDNYLLSLLEDRIVQVKSPRGGVFHPKLWLLRYKAEEEEKAPLYRLLNMSRNLTFDKSWDLMLRLEGHVATYRTRAYGRNHPLGDFVRHLPSLAVYNEERDKTEQMIDLLQDEVRRVNFQVPEPFHQDILAFYPSGVPGYLQGFRFDTGCSRAMVISPFLSDHLLTQVTAHSEGHILVSRIDSLASLHPQTRERFARLYAFDGANPSLDEEEQNAHLDTGEEVVGAKPEPSGLHAKLFILESGWDAKWLVGSANATSAAFERKNVEFMIALGGRKSKIGIDQVLGDKKDNNAFLSLLKTYVPQDDGIENDESVKRMEELANNIRTWLVDLDMRLTVEQYEADRFDLALCCDRVDQNLPTTYCHVRCWPVTLQAESAISLEFASPLRSIVFADLSLLALTPFIAFHVKVETEDAKHVLRFVLKLPISGLPEARSARVIGAVLSDRSRFLRYLWLLLSQEEGLPKWLATRGNDQQAAWTTVSALQERPLLEALVRALSRSPETIDRIAKLIDALRRTPQGLAVLPEGFRTLWEAVIQIRSDIG